jgi:multidrug resistance efflux pump
MEVPVSTSSPAAATVAVPDARNRSVQPRPPARWQSLRILAEADLASMARSWLVRGFLLVSAILTVLELKGMQADRDPASQMLEVVYATYILIWMHGVVFIAGSALAREQECLSDAILSRGITRGEYMGSKILARCLATLLLLGVVLLPSSFWAIRNDKLVRTETGFLSAKADSVKVEAWEPKKVFTELEGPLLQMDKQLGDMVHAGDVLALIDDRKYYDDLESERRLEEDALNEVDNAHRRADNAQRAVALAEEALARAERSLVAKDLASKAEQADRAADLRIRKRELMNAENDQRVAQDAITKAERGVASARARLLDARKRLSRATITAPISGYLTEVLVQASQVVNVGTHLFTIAPLDQYQLRVPVYNFKEFKRLKEGLDAYITIQKTEYKGVVARLGAMTEADRWGRPSNYVVVRFRGDGSLGMLGLTADVRIVLPPSAKPINRATALLDTLTGHGKDDLESRTASVTVPWMLIALGKVLGCACFLVTLTLLLLVTFRNALIAILGTIGFWHVSNLIFDFAGLPALSYLEMVRTMDKVLGGIALPGDELTVLAWLAGLSIVLAAGTLALFIGQDPPQ